MGRPTTRSALLERIESDDESLWSIVDTVPSEHRESSGACAHWSVTNLLAHLDSWHCLFVGWERQGRAGGRPAVPAPGLT